MQMYGRVGLWLCLAFFASCHSLPQCDGPAQYALLTGADDRQGHWLVFSVYSMLLSHVRYSPSAPPPTIFVYVSPESTDHYRVLFDCVRQGIATNQQVVVLPRSEAICENITRPGDSESFVHQCQFNFARYFPQLYLPCMPPYLFWMDADMLVVGNLTTGVEEMLNKRDWMIGMKLDGRPTYGASGHFTRQELQILQSVGLRITERAPNNGLLVLDTKRWLAERGSEQMVQATNRLRDSNFRGSMFTTMLSSQTPTGLLTSGPWASSLVDLPKLWNVDKPREAAWSLRASNHTLHNTSIVLHLKSRAKPVITSSSTHSGKFGPLVVEWTKLLSSSALQQCLRLEALANVPWAAKLRS